MSFPVTSQKTLKLRKDIWSKFPVIVIPLGRGTDGAERHAIVWHRKKLAEMRSKVSVDNWKNFDIHQHAILMESLQASKRWTVETSTHPEYICVIRMNFPSVIPPAANYESPAICSPVLTRLNDIKIHFPVVWHDVSAPNAIKKTYSIELHHSTIYRLSKERNSDAEDQIVGLLMRALKASTAWRVLQPESDTEFCRIEMLC